MDERWREMWRIFHEAAVLAPAERAAFLRDACRDDVALRSEVESLLLHDGNPEALRTRHDQRMNLIGQRIGVYEVRSLLGVGGMGEVYRGRDTKLGRDVAIKVLPAEVAADAERLARFEREARILASMNHPHIGAIHGFEEGAGIPALILELVEGDTLAERIAKGPMPVPAALAIARQIAEALEAAHEHGIIHRDLKPANIKITPDSVVKVLDFGLAKAADAHDVSVDTHAGLILGTAAYMSPEQARGKAVDKRADIWAFGCVLFEMLTAKRTFDGEDVTATLARILECEPDWHKLPANLPPSIHRLLRRCLEKDARRRFKDIGDIAIEIEDASLTAAPMPGRQQGRRLGWLAAGVLVGGVAASALLVLRPVAVRETEAIRFSFETPVMHNPYALAMSPDGRHIAFAAAPSGGATMLYVRPLGSVEAKLLPGTEGAVHPFWSPDSRQVGFADGFGITTSSARRLKAIEASGGSSRVLTELAGPFTGATWNSDGVIVFSDDGVLHRVSDAGGTAVRLSRANQLRSAHWPQFLPDGRRYLYLVNDQASDHVIAVGSLDGHEPKELMRSESAGLYAPPGFLLFLRQRTLMAQRFNAANLRLQGEPNRVESNVLTNPVSGRGAFAVSHTGILAYRAGDMEATPRKLVRTDRSGSSELIGDLLPFGNPYIRLSPDGTRVAFDDQLMGREQDVWIYDLQRNLRFPLTRDQADDHRPVWSPDSTKLGFDSNRNGPAHVLYEKAADGAIPERILLPPAPGMTYGLLDWTSEFVVFFRGKLDAKTGELWAQPISGDRRPFPFVASDVNSALGDGSVALSPDSRWLAYTVNDGGTSQVVVRSFPDPSKHRQQISTKGGMCPRWRHDGRELFYLDSTRKVVAVAVVADHAFKIERSAELFAAPGAFTTMCGYDVTADGQHFLFNIAGDSAPATSPITIVSNWLAELKKDTKD